MLKEEKKEIRINKKQKGRGEKEGKKKKTRRIYE
jgi:hypothetical protein